MRNPFGSRQTLTTAAGAVDYFALSALEARGLGSVARLPYSIRVLLENLLRNCDGFAVGEGDVETLARWDVGAAAQEEIAFLPARVLLQDFTGVPAVVDLAAMRAAMVRLGGDPKKINPLIPVDLVIDHSVQTDFAGTPESFRQNAELEYTRNRERYEFLRWGQQAFANFRVVPPATGIIHQINLEYLGQVVQTRELDGKRVALPDTLVGTDSHTTMINGLGIVGWGVGGIEAEAVMLGQPIYMLTPKVVGMRLDGALPAGSTATDLVLAVTQALRAHNVVDKFVEFHGPGLASLSLPDRAVLANMAPEYGATMGFFPVDDVTLSFLRDSGREAGLVDLVERYSKAQGLFRTEGAPEPVYHETLALDMGAVESCLAGPKRPQDRVNLSSMKTGFRQALLAPVAARGFGLDEGAAAKKAETGRGTLTHGSVVIASITSCTNTSNPSLMLGAGILARKAVEAGLTVPSYVKTSLSPGSRVVQRYLETAGLFPFMEALRFHNTGYGCMTCIGNSGPLDDEIARAVKDNDLVVAGVLSGNRNFEGRINASVRANYLASPLLVVAYALAGTVDIDFATEALGTGKDGRPVFLKDIWPSRAEIEEVVARSVSADDYREVYRDVFAGDDTWRALPVSAGDLYAFAPASTYVREPSFFTDLAREPRPVAAVSGARALVVVGDSVTTDHISPAGSIAKTSPAAAYLGAQGVDPADFNSYGSRRGNHEVMVRGTYANIRLKNLLVPGTEGGVTVHLPDGGQTSVYDAAERYRAEGVPLVALAGKDYGMGSSRDWAAKGAYLLGIRAVIAESYERIHRSNLVGMGVLPLQFLPGQTRESLGLTGRERYDVAGLAGDVAPRQAMEVVATADDGHVTKFQVTCRIDTPVEVQYFRHGGILPFVLRSLL